MSHVRRFLRHFVPVLAVLAEVWMMIGVILRLTDWRDCYDGLALVYYTTPWPVVAVGFALLALRARWRLQPRAVSVRGMMAALAGFAWLLTSWYMGAPSGASPDFRLVLWNVRNNDMAAAQIAAHLRAYAPDIIAFAEGGTRLSGVDRWRENFPDYSVERLPGQMILLSKTKIQAGPRGQLTPGSYFAANSTELTGRTVTVLQTDIDARPVRSRKQALAALTDQVKKRAGDPLIVLGDFNTPRQSYHLDPIRGMLNHAFEARGRGLADTWPVPFPVLSLDQIWVSPELEVVSCRQGWSLLSDHRPVFVELRFKQRHQQPGSTGAGLNVRE